MSETDATEGTDVGGVPLPPGAPLPPDEPPPPAGKKPKSGNKKAVKRLTKHRRNLVIAVVVEAALVVAFGTWLIVELAGGSGGQRKANAIPQASSQTSVSDAFRASAMDTAKSYAIDFSTYDYQHLDQDFQTVTSHLAPSFKAQYSQTVASLKAIVVQYKGSATATVQGVGLASISPTQAVVLVFLDQKVTNTNLKAPRIDTNRLQITLERTGGTWLMSDLQLK